MIIGIEKILQNKKVRSTATFVAKQWINRFGGASHRNICKNGANVTVRRNAPPTRVLIPFCYKCCGATHLFDSVGNG
jgi:hypothetical protein